MSDLSPANLPAVPPLCDPRRQAIFCEALAASGNVRAAAGAACISPQTAYRTRRASSDFARLWDAALIHARAAVEQVLADRALNGVEEAVFYHGEEVATRRRFDTRLLLAHLARLDQLAGQAVARADAEAFDEALEMLAAGVDLPQIDENGLALLAQQEEAEAALDEGEEDYLPAADMGEAAPPPALVPLCMQGRNILQQNPVPGVPAIEITRQSRPRKKGAAIAGSAPVMR